MISTSPAQHASDPTLASLVPRRSPRRNVGLLLAAVATLVAIGWLGVNGRPDLRSQTGSATVLPGAQVLADAQVTPSGLPSVTLSSITPPPGMRVAGAWVLDTADPLAPHDATSEGARDQLLAGARASQALPQELEAGREVDLVVLFDVVDCGTLAEGGGGALSGSTTAHLRTSLGATAVVAVPTLDSWLDRASLTELGACPPE